MDVELHIDPKTKIVVYERYGLDGVCHHWDDKPAIVQRHSNGVIAYERYVQDNKLHRAGGKPAYILYDEQGRVKFREWAIEGQRFRPDDLPNAEFVNPESGVVYKAQYRVSDTTRSCGYHLHRENGPAAIHRDPHTGDLIRVSYYYNGARIKPPAPPALTPGMG